MGQQVAVELFKPRAERESANAFKFTNVYVKNLPESYSQEQLDEVRW